MHRWVVEARNGHIKSLFKILAGIVPYAHVLHLANIYKIAAAMINRYHKPLLMPTKTVELAQSIALRVNMPNVVQAYVETHRLQTRHARWIPLEEGVLTNFPRFDEDNIKSVTIGVYQLSLAPSYIQHKFDHDGGE